MHAWLKLRNALAVGLTGLLAALSFTAHAADWPARPVTVVVPFVAGGTTDIVARLIGQKLGELWGQPVVIDNRGGAGGNIGAGIVAKATPDGYTLLMTSGSIVTVNPHIYKDMGFKVSDLMPVTNVASGPMVVAVSATQGPATLKDLIAAAKAKPGALNFGSAGIGSQVHMAGENFANAAGIDIVHVPYKGEAAAYADLMAGQVQLVVGNIGAVAGFVNQGRLRALAVTSKERSPMLPNVPTANEAGMPGFENTGWFGFMAPAGTPQAIVDKVQRDTVRVLQMPDVKEKLAKIGMLPVGNSPADFATEINTELKTWGDVVKNRHLKQN
ncbi:MAG TPA: tripartite tricarboxylate transporter substrate binding protein [Ramlibacter sp.]|jgi:tripartite-type tricarboxylate transporter receptor subunit TctC